MYVHHGAMEARKGVGFPETEVMDGYGLSWLFWVLPKTYKCSKELSHLPSPETPELSRMLCAPEGSELLTGAWRTPPWVHSYGLSLLQNPSAANCSALEPFKLSLNL